MLLHEILSQPVLSVDFFISDFIDYFWGHFKKLLKNYQVFTKAIKTNSKIRGFFLHEQVVTAQADKITKTDFID